MSGILCLFTSFNPVPKTMPQNMPIIIMMFPTSRCTLSHRWRTYISSKLASTNVPKTLVRAWISPTSLASSPSLELSEVPAVSDPSSALGVTRRFIRFMASWLHLCPPHPATLLCARRVTVYMYGFVILGSYVYRYRYLYIHACIGAPTVHVGQCTCTCIIRIHMYRSLLASIIH